MAKNLLVSEDSLIEFVFGLVFLLIALVIGFALVGNVYALTAAVVMLLIKDGLPNAVIGGKNLIFGEGEKK